MLHQIQYSSKLKIKYHTICTKVKLTKSKYRYKFGTRDLDYIKRTLEEKCFAAATMVASGPVADTTSLLVFTFLVVVSKKNDNNDFNFEVTLFFFSFLFFSAILASFVNMTFSS